MNVSPEPPERLAEILQEILALSDSTRTNQSESISRDRSGLSEAHCVDDEPQRRDEKNDNRQRP